MYLLSDFGINFVFSLHSCVSSLSLSASSKVSGNGLPNVSGKFIDNTQHTNERTPHKSNGMLSPKYLYLQEINIRIVSKIIYEIPVQLNEGATIPPTLENTVHNPTPVLRITVGNISALYRYKRVYAAEILLLPRIAIIVYNELGCGMNTVPIHNNPAINEKANITFLRPKRYMQIVTNTLAGMSTADMAAKVI